MFQAAKGVDQLRLDQKISKDSAKSDMELTSRITRTSREKSENTSYIPFKFQMRPKINKDAKKKIMEKKSMEMDINMMESLADMTNKKRKSNESPGNDKKKNRKGESTKEKRSPENLAEKVRSFPYLCSLFYVYEMCISNMKFLFYILKKSKWKRWKNDPKIKIMVLGKKKELK